MAVIPEQALDVIFRQARTHTVWLNKPVTDETLRGAYELAKLGPTSANTMPMRVVFVRSPEAKARLKPTLDAGNVDKTMAAPVTAIFAYDMKFYEFVPRLFPHAPKFGDAFADPKNSEHTKTHAFRNATLQSAYFLIAARAMGLDCGPMSGFNNSKLDAEFFPDGRWRSNFLMNLGYADASKVKPRLERLPFDEACRIV
jgi:3-hydroxypropanoate dehydrogenase